MNLFVESKAIFSPCRNYRFYLLRRWADGPLAHFCMLNPSKADEVQNDPTVERQCRRVQLWGYGGLIVTNAFAWRSTDPKALYSLDDPVGSENDKWILQAATEAEITVCGWGGHGKLRGRGDQVRNLLSQAVKVHYLRMGVNGQPWHPLYLSYELKPQVWERAL